MAGNDARPLAPHSKTIFLLCIALCAASLPGAAPTRQDSHDFAAKIAFRYGFQDFPSVRSLHYVIHVRSGDKGKERTREWTWFPHEDSVVYRGEDAKDLTLTASYSRRNQYSLASEAVAAIDRDFVLDQYWFLFPLHLRWDEASYPSLGPGGNLRVRYPKHGGPAPASVIEVTATADGTVTAWSFQGNAKDTSVVRADWSAPKVIDGLPVSLDRRLADGSRIWFSAVKVSRSTP